MGARDLRDRTSHTQLGERTRDALITNPTRQLGFIGAKPQRFNRWILDLLGYTDGGVIDDLFPGTDGMARTLEAPLLPLMQPDQ